MSLNIKKGVKKAIIFFLILGLVFTVVVTVTNLAGDRLFPRKTMEILIDSDSGNEIDDLFAITRALIAPELEVVGLTSVHYVFAENAGDTSLSHSQFLNEKILRLLKKENIPHPEGAKDMLRFYGNPLPQASPASNLIIRKAHETAKNKKLNIVTLGAMTNVASAIIMDPEIIPKIRVFMMGLKYDPVPKSWNKNEFNARNDLDAMDIVLNTSGLEIDIMTASASSELVFGKQEAEKYLRGKGGIWDFLINKWDERFPQQQEWIMWDVALIEALIDPSLTRSEKTLTPPENTQRTVNVFTSVNKELMTASFYAAILKAQRAESDD